MPLQATSGAASYDAFGGGVPVVPNYIEEVFSTYLYTGNGSTQTITNGIDLSTKGGMVWLKARNAAYQHGLFDTARGASKGLVSNTTDAEATFTSLTSFNTDGFSLGSDYNGGATYASWTFRKQAKFFDVVTGSQSVAGNVTFNHNLGSVPGCILLKSTSNVSGGGEWTVYHRSLGTSQYLVLNSTAAASSAYAAWGGVAPTSTQFTMGYVYPVGTTVVAYLFAHNAGGFGLTGTDNVISCGSWTGTGSTFNVNLGYEPQWLMFKRTDDVGDWIVIDNMRGFTTTGADAYLRPNTSGAESNITGGATLNSTGFSWATGAGTNFIYIAIRRGPMKVPTSGTSVFDPEAYTGTSATRTITSGFPVDLSISKIRSQNYPGGWFDRLRGALQVIRSSSTDPEATSADSLTSFASMTGVVLGTDPSGRINTSPDTYAMWNFQRAPSFFDEVCVTTSGYEVTATHNLGVRPELIIGKARNQTGSWVVWASSVAALNVNNTLILNTTAAATNNGMPINTVTATSFYAAIAGVPVETEVFYLFATCAGVSKVGSYTGTGALQTVNCGFTSGARFVLIKRTDSTGDWYVWDSARGIVAGNDPYLLLNSTAAEVTNTDYVDTYSAGFEISSTAPAAINASGGSFIFLAIA